MVTGASRGLGRAVAEGYAAHGARLVVTATRAERLDAVAAAIRSGGGDCHPLALDLGDPASVEAAGRAAVAALGRIDVLVSNAGVLGERVPLAEYPMAGWREVIEVNLTGTLALVQALVPAMAPGGVVITVSSGAAGRPGWGAYGISKLALDGVAAVLRDELAPAGIRSISVNPGGLRTAMRAAAYPDEDPATLPHPSGVVEPFVAIAAGADPGPRVDAQRWSP